MARVADEEIERLKVEVDLVELVIGSGVVLKQAGGDLVGCCPFHDDQTPSLVVTPVKGLWHCMGACQTGGSVIDWVMRTQRVSFRHAVEVLRAGVTPVIVPGRGRAVATVSTSRQLPSPVDVSGEDWVLLSQVIDFYHQTLLDGSEALEYLARRRIDCNGVVDRFSLGYANRTLGYRLPVKQTKAGAAVRGRLARLGVFRASGHEHLAGSLVIPVIDPSGVVTDLYGRKITPNLRAGTPNHLYLPGPHRGVWNEAGLADGEVILCESLIDALTFHSAGFEHVTASYGASGFTAAHRDAFARHGVSRVLIAYDHDTAGDEAATKLCAELIAVGIECFRVVLPAGLDVNDVAVKAKHPQDALGTLIRHAVWIGAGTSPGCGGVRSAAAEVDAPSTAGVAPVSSSAAFGVAPADQPVAVVEPLMSSGPAVSPVPVVSPVPAPAVPAEVEVGVDELVVVIDQHRWRVRGFGKVSVAETLRVNVAVSDETGGLHVDSLDLYSSKARGVFVREAASELHVDEQMVKTELGRVLLATEQAIADTTRVSEPEVMVMSDADRTAAMALLKAPDLADRIVGDVARLGLVGEEINVLVCYLAVISRKGDKPLGVLVQSSSAAGKSTLAEAVLSLVPEEDLVAYSAMTGQSLYYLGETDLAHKVLSVAEEEGASRASYALKLLQSEGRLSIASTGKDPVSGKLTTHTYSVEGPVALLTTTTQVDVDEELANRLIVLSVAEDAGQTRAIHDAQREALTLDGLLARSRRAATVGLHRNAQRLLEPLPVVVPDAAKLSFPHVTTRARRDHAKYLGLICASALLHQHQRTKRTVEVDGAPLTYIEATAADVVLADRLAGDVLVRDGSELTPATRRVLDALISWAPDGSFTRKAARDATGVGDTQMKVHLARLVDLEYVVAGRDGTTPTYELACGYDAARSDFPDARSGLQPAWSGAGRRAVGSRSDTPTTPFPQVNNPERVGAVGFGGIHVTGGRDLVVVAHTGTGRTHTGTGG